MALRLATVKKCLVYVGDAPKLCSLSAANLSTSRRNTKLRPSLRASQGLANRGVD
jgi:hypothetical protein